MSGRRTAWIASGVALGMLAMAYAAVPLYDLFCDVTGYGGETRVAVAAPSEALDRRVEMRLDANVAKGLSLAFKPEEVSRPLRLGETAISHYTLTNTGPEPVTVVASYNVTPHKAGPYFRKIECFCFEDQALAPGETRRLSVLYFIDPELAGDYDTREVSAVTLSYTFHPSQTQAAADAAGRLSPLGASDGAG